MIQTPFQRTIVWPILYVLAILTANFLIVTFGPIPVWPYPLLFAPAGVLAAGFTFTFRNMTQLKLGRFYGYGAIIVGAAFSYFISAGVTLDGGLVPLAWASGISFLLSETADALVWTPLSDRGWRIRAMGLGDLAGQFVDSVVFLLLAFGAPGVLGFLLGQFIGKSYCTWITVAVMKPLRAPSTVIRAASRVEV